MTSRFAAVGLLASLATLSCESAPPVNAPVDAAVSSGDAAPDATPDATPDAAVDATPAALTFRGQALGAPDRTLTDVDAIGYDVTLALDNNTAGSESYRAEVTGTFLATRALARMTLDFEGNDIEAVSVDGATATFTRETDQLTVNFPSPIADGQGFRVNVRYRGTFRQSRGSSSGFNTNGGLFVVQRSAARPRIFMSLDWPTRTRRWLPVRDHPRDGAMLAMRATFPSEMTVISNGRRLSNEAGEGNTRTWQYEALTPMPVYDFHLAATDGWSDHELPAAQNGVRIHYFDYPASDARAAMIYADSPANMDFYVNTFGAYRWDTLAFLQEPAIGGGMEHATVVSIDDSLYTSVPVTRQVAIHEMAHHWNGNLLRIDTWNDLWVSEGFCDYFTARYIEEHDGVAAARTVWQSYLADGIRTEHTPPTAMVLPLRAPDPERAPLDVFTQIVYKKGAFILRMLEQRLGRPALTAFLRGWYERHAYGHVDTATLQRELQTATSTDLSDFFNAWVFGPFHPVLSVSATYDDTGASVTIDQRQTAGPADGFSAPLELEFTNGATTQRATVNLHGRHQTERVVLPFRANAVRVDPDVRLYAAQSCDASHPCPTGQGCTTFAGSGLAVCSQ